MPGGKPWTPEEAREAARLSAEARRRKKDLTPAERAEEAAGKEAPALIKELLDAALGRGDFNSLGKELRLKALFRALEYSVGKPVTSKRPSGEAPEDEGFGELFDEEPPPSPPREIPELEKMAMDVLSFKGEPTRYEEGMAVPTAWEEEE
jgi:hypothetical protein